MRLYSAEGDVTRLISPSSFAGQYQEKRIQSWADLNPAVINDGQPMLSLGTEIATKYGLSIDNLFIDGDECLVAAEMKRLGDCQFRLDVFKRKSVSLGLSFRKTSAPGLREWLAKREGTWRSAFPAKFHQSDYETVSDSLMLDLPRPEIGNKDQLKVILSNLANMTASLCPLIDEYFVSNHTSADRPVDPNSSSNLIRARTAENPLSQAL